MASPNGVAAPGARSTLAPTKLTTAVLGRLAVGQRVRDTTVRGFFAERGQRGVSLKVQADLWSNGARGERKLVKTVRVTLGAFPDLGLDEARARAMALLADVKRGIDPAATASPAARARPTWTVGALLEEYLADLALRERSPNTAAHMRKMFTRYLSEWGPLGLGDVTREMCRRRHAELTQHGKSAANHAMRTLRTCMNFALRRLDVPELAGNPVMGVTFHRARSREAYIKFDDLASWIAKVRGLDNPLRAAMHELQLFTGLRPGTVSVLERAWLDPAASCIRIPAKAMKAGRGFTCPLSSHALGVVRGAMAAGDVLFPGSPFLFPTRSADGKRVIPAATWRERSLPSETGHIVRHTFSTAAVAAGVSSSDRMLLLAQKPAGVEGVYMQPRALEAHLLAQSERVTAFLLSQIAPGSPRPLAAS